MAATDYQCRAVDALADLAARVLSEDEYDGEQVGVIAEDAVTDFLRAVRDDADRRGTSACAACGGSGGGVESALRCSWCGGSGRA